MYQKYIVEYEQHGKEKADDVSALMAFSFVLSAQIFVFGTLGAFI